MTEDLLEVPLFPLGVVLFPGMALPLHIFEPRYREMMATCLAEGLPFGIVLALSESEAQQAMPARVGTLARIVDHQKLPDGRYNLLAAGTRRFEIIQIVRETPYLTAHVRPFTDTDEGCEDARALVPEVRRALRHYLHAVLQLTTGEECAEECPIAIPDTPDDLSFLVGMCLTDDADKQRLLEMTSVTERLRIGAQLLRQETSLLAEHPDISTRIHPDPDRALLN